MDGTLCHVEKVQETVIEIVHHAVANQNHIWSFQICDIIWRHDNLPGGNEYHDALR